MLKSGFPKSLLHSRSAKRKAPIAFKSFRGSHFRVLREREWRGGKKNALQERWGSDKGKNKKGVGYCVQVSGSHWSARRDPLRGRDPGFVPFGLGTEAAAASGWGPVPESS